MSVSLFHRFQVKDFAAWLNPDPGVPAKTMKDNGVLAYSLHRNPDDPNTLMIYCQFPDMDTLKAYVAFLEALPGVFVKRKGNQLTAEKGTTLVNPAEL